MGQQDVLRRERTTGPRTYIAYSVLPERQYADNMVQPLPSRLQLKRKSVYGPGKFHERVLGIACKTALVELKEVGALIIALTQKIPVEATQSSLRIESNR